MPNSSLTIAHSFPEQRSPRQGAARSEYYRGHHPMCDQQKQSRRGDRSQCNHNKMRRREQNVSHSPKAAERGNRIFKYKRGQRRFKNPINHGRV